MLSGNFSKSAFESNGISGTENWATMGTPATPASIVAIERTRSTRLIVMAVLLSLRRGRGWLRLQRDLLHAPRLDLRHDDLVRVPAIQHVNNLKAAELLAGMTELAE